MDGQTLLRGADRYGCSDCDVEKAWDWWARQTLWEKVSVSVKPLSKPKRGRPKAK